MATTPTAARQPDVRGERTLVGQVTCPHCWSTFPPEDVLWASEHVDLLGDPRLGPEQPQRFLPSRFTPEGEAIDARGLPCRILACPRCHLAVPRSLLEVEPVFLSILGAPSSGKSYLLTSMTWELRRVLPHAFKVSFADADPTANRALCDCEEGLFLNPEPGRLTPLGGLIRKTELQGELYDTVTVGRQTISYPRPFLFLLRPEADHPNVAKAESLTRVLCLYDNAGEHFHPGQDTTSSPVTRHLAYARVILFLFDPTQDPRFRAACRITDDAEAVKRSGRQEILLNEAAARLRRYTGLAPGAKYQRPLIVVVTKYDRWSHMIGLADGADPWRTTSGGSVVGLDVDRIGAHSQALRRLLEASCPEVVAAAEGLASDVTYVGLSALGDAIEKDPATGLPGIRPKDIRPRWASVPGLLALARACPGLVPRIGTRPRSS